MNRNSEKIYVLLREDSGDTLKESAGFKSQDGCYLFTEEEARTAMGSFYNRAFGTVSAVRVQELERILSEIKREIS